MIFGQTRRPWSIVLIPERYQRYPVKAEQVSKQVVVRRCETGFCRRVLWIWSVNGKPGCLEHNLGVAQGCQPIGVCPIRSRQRKVACLKLLGWSEAVLAE